MIAKEDIDKAVRESFDVVKVTNVIYDEIQKAFTKGFDLGVKFADNGNEMLKKHCMQFNQNTMIDFGAYVLYYSVNPKSKMDVPNCIYEQVERMYAEWNKKRETQKFEEVEGA